MNDIVWLDDVPPAKRWKVNDARFRVGDHHYLATMKHRSTSDRLCVKKPPALIEATVALLEQFRQANIVELGISQGGSTALAAQVADPHKLVAIELAPEPVEPLEQFIDATDRRARVRPYYGVDQGDRERLVEILDREFRDEPIDLVVDDASHLLAESRTSFEVLFPRLRPGGLYVIEDWNWEHLRAEAIRRNANEPGTAANAAIAARIRERRREKAGDTAAAAVVRPAAVTPLTILVMELLVTRAASGDIVDELTVKDMWVCVRRGAARVDPSGFRLADHVQDQFRLLPRTVDE